MQYKIADNLENQALPDIPRNLGKFWNCQGIRKINFFI